MTEALLVSNVLLWITVVVLAVVVAALVRQIGAIGVVDALSGDLVREIDEAGISGPLLIVPPGP